MFVITKRKTCNCSLNPKTVGCSLNAFCISDLCASLRKFKEIMLHEQNSSNIFVIIVAYPNHCWHCTFSPENDRAECDRCETGFGVVNETKTCAGDYVN